MANEGLGRTSTIFDAAALGTTYATPVVLTPKAGNRLALTVSVTAGDATSVEVQVRSRRDGTGTFVPRGADTVCTLGAGEGFAANQGEFRVMVDNISRDERDIDVSVKRTGGAGATCTVTARFERSAVPVAS